MTLGVGELTHAMAEGRTSFGHAPVVCRLLPVLRGAIRIRQLLLVLRRQLRGIERDRQLVDRASECEWDLIIVVIHRRTGVRADVEGLIPRQEQRHRAVHRLRRDHFAIDLEQVVYL